ncbi:MAG TPA: diadenylate cyclase [Candidatus Acidoferrales bacterium]|nr:diadenylate cyclase [Candidatus Acidoferrales bacterium]
MFFHLSDIGLSDIVDIAFVTVLLYVAFVWVRETRAFFVAIGFVILGLIYIVAKSFDLQLTAWIFQGFFAILLVIIVVIFQEELRQIFERIAVWSLGRSAPKQYPSSTVDTLVATLADFARDRIGALIVIPGKQPIDRHIQGGIELNGRLSEPLLKSIFDPHSPGHDGAVIVENDRVVRFAAHLPLSKNFTQLAHVGTRHSAALGLAELTDALCLIVSEERGRISVARNSRLWEVDNTQQLGSLIDSFLREKMPVRDPRMVSLQLLKENWVEKAVALSLAFGLWAVFVPGSKTAEATFSVPVTVENVPSNVVVESVQPPEVSATFSGPRRALVLFRPEKLRVTVDGSTLDANRRDGLKRTYRLSEKDIRYPKELMLKDFSPSTVKVAARRVTPDSKESARGEAQTKAGETS